MKNESTIAFVGNPNCGKTTLFNAFTGADLKVANWPGVTVEKVEGTVSVHGRNMHLVDLPGIYSLTSYTMEEQISRHFIMSNQADVVINVVDASSLERNLYLTLQLLELGKPVIVALNMMDIVKKRGIKIDIPQLSRILGVPVVSVSARKRIGLDILLRAAEIQRLQGDKAPPPPLLYSKTLEEHLALISVKLQIKYPGLPHVRWYALKFLEQDREIQKQYPLHLPPFLIRNRESEIINEKFQYIEEILSKTVVNRERQAAMTDRADKLLTHAFWGIPIFLTIMALVFFLTFFLGDWLKGFFELGISWFSDAVTATLSGAGVGHLLISLIVDGILAGVGGILTFLPNIFILFLALAFLEDSGYMARVAYIMEGIMSRLGLSGRAFIPMILGFGCTVPAIMASRVLENRRDRFCVMLITPFMSCSARLPVYILFSGMFFPGCAMLVAYSMYLIGLVVAILIAAVLHRANPRHRENYLLIELPDYKAPSARTTGIYVWEKVKDYLTRAGTVIFIASVVMWMLMNFGTAGYSGEIEHSFAAYIGRALVPFFTPLGLGFWQISVALLAGISAKEVVVSSCAVLFSIGSINSAAGMEHFHSALTAIGFGPLNAFCLMLFCLLYIPCVAALASIRRESGSWKWTCFTAFFQLATAWVFTFAAYTIGSLF